MKVRRIWGPPGTGKTTTLAKRVQATVRERGPDSICIVSFSVTAAQEIASRPGVKGILPPHAIGTLHSAAYRACGHPPVALDPKVLADWNGQVGGPWRITGDTRGPRGLESRDRAGAGALETGDALLEELDLLRARAVPRAEWPIPVREFAKRWTAWKRDAGGDAGAALDFSDMIVNAYHRARDGEPMPGNPSVLVADEAQDMTPIEIALTLEWGRLLGDDGRLVYALDDDQAIFDWRGGDPTGILELDDCADEVLAQSWRVPPAVHAVAEQWITRVSSRYPKLYHPRGPVERDPTPAHSQGWAHAVGYSVSDRALLDAIEADLADPDATVMVIASCGYMLAPLIKMLRERGIPFHNPYRPSEQAWNPLGKPGRGMSTPERIWRYAVLDERTCGTRARTWTGDDLQAWVPLVDAKAACLARGAKSGLDQLPSGTVPWELVASLWRNDAEGDEALRRATGGDDDPADHLRWLTEVISPAKAKVGGYPLTVARTYGPTALVDTPRVVIGTIHSTKGAQADCSPPDEPVLTVNRGYVPIGQLDPERDRLVSYNDHHHKIHRGGPRRPDGYRFRMGSRPYSGDLLTLSTPLTRTRVTPNHHLTVRWAPLARDAWALYLMRRETDWRVGTTKLQQTSATARGSSGLRGRLMREGGDAVWLLALFDDQDEALAAEKVVAWTHGVPDLTFRASARDGSDDRLAAAQRNLDRVWSRLETESRAKGVLDAFGQSAEWPILTPGGQKMGMRHRFQVRAGSFMEGWMELPTDPGSGQAPRWCTARVDREHYEGPVYSLDVERWHHYVSGGAIVHNCVYLAPDLSGAGMRQWRADVAGRDQAVRLAYVGMTRAFHALRVLAPMSDNTLPVREMLPVELEVRP